MAQHHETSPRAHAAPSSQPFDKIWLPRALYEAIPYFYLLGGVAALFATLYINAGYWLAPEWILFTALCIHAGARILWLRYVGRRGNESIDADAAQ
ncbi:MAG: hypothetical protein AAFO81_07995 [Pseudomonadota bacterium]